MVPPALEHFWKALQPPHVVSFCTIEAVVVTSLQRNYEQSISLCTSRCPDSNGTPTLCDAYSLYRVSSSMCINCSAHFNHAEHLGRWLCQMKTCGSRFGRRYRGRGWGPGSKMMSSSRLASSGAFRSRMWRSFTTLAPSGAPNPTRPPPSSAS